MVVPALPHGRAAAAELVERLEVYYLANPRGHLHFALVTDWTDGPYGHMPGDDSLVATLAAGIDRLNRQCEAPPDGGERFLLLHRRRQWNQREGKWIGWERKRGKLHELHRLLRGATDTSFIAIGGRPPSVPQGVRYAITLVADTRSRRTPPTTWSGQWPTR